MADVDLNPAEVASAKALEALRDAIARNKHFKLEAGAGAGKTYSLIETLKFLVGRDGALLARSNQRIACITFTNVAKDEIELRTDKNPVIHCDTIHAFSWSVISGFQALLRKHLTELAAWSNGTWADRLNEAGGVDMRRIEYTLGYRSISDTAVSIHHNDVLPLTIRLMQYEKFRNILRFRYPIILIDEYQDTDADWTAALRQHYFSAANPPLLGFFGDHWQKIYGEGCGEISDPALVEVGKAANFRSVSAIVDCLNRLRPELKQFVANPEATGEVRIFHTNRWVGERQKSSHHKDDLPDQSIDQALEITRDQLEQYGWDLSSSSTKILMLTHRALGKRQGYESLPSVFQDNSSFAKKEQAHIAYFADVLEPAVQAFMRKSYGEMFSLLGANRSYILSAVDKKRWSESMSQLVSLRETGKVREVVDHLRATKLPRLSEVAEKLEARLESFDVNEQGDMPRSLVELQKLHEVPYKEIIALCAFLDGHSPFETKHGVKGAEFENVLVVVGRGWNKYNFGKMLEEFPGRDSLVGDARSKFEDNRNLFYVACSRPKKRLAILFTQFLSDDAISTVEHLFGSDNTVSLY